MRSIILTTLSISLISGCAVTPAQWQANTYYDEFTDERTCRIEMGTPKQRAMDRAVFGTYITHNFYVENHEGELRVGVRSEPAIPISGDVQVRVGDKLYTITAHDTPIDLAPEISQTNNPDTFEKSYASTMETIQKFSSPYRIYTGEQAKELLKDIIHHKGEVKFRTIGVNNTLSQTGRFTVDDNFILALKQCGIEP